MNWTDWADRYWVLAVNNKRRALFNSTEALDRVILILEDANDKNVGAVLATGFFEGKFENVILLDTPQVARYWAEWFDQDSVLEVRGDGSAALLRVSDWFTVDGSEMLVGMQHREVAEPRLAGLDAWTRIDWEDGTRYLVKE